MIPWLATGNGIRANAPFSLAAEFDQLLPCVCIALGHEDDCGWHICDLPHLPTGDSGPSCIAAWAPLPTWDLTALVLLFPL